MSSFELHHPEYYFLLIGIPLLSNSHWQAFGYNKRPKRGSIFRSLMPKEKREREDVLRRELLGADFGRAVRWANSMEPFHSRTDFIARLFEISIGGDEPFWKPLFPSREVGIRFLLRVSEEYMQEDSLAPSDLFIRRCKKQLNQKLPNDWIEGANWLFNSPESTIVQLDGVLSQAGITARPESDFGVKNHQFIELAKGIAI